MQTKLVKQKDFLSEGDEFYAAIVKDIKQSLIQFVSERGHGKSTSLKNIIKRCQDQYPDLEFYIADTSQSWYKKAPVPHRQLVTREKINAGQVANIPNCVYEIGSLTEAERRVFLAVLIGQQYKKRYELSLNDQEAYKRLPYAIYVVEEANTIFNSYSLRKNDWVSPVLQDFVSVGRNYKMSAFLVATAEEGEISPSLRRRSRRIYGRLVAEGDIARVRRTDKQMAEYLSKEIPRFNFVYWGSRFYGPVLVKDVVTTVPVDYIVGEPVKEASKFNAGWWMQFMLGFGVTLMFIWFFIQ